MGKLPYVIDKFFKVLYSFIMIVTSISEYQDAVAERDWRPDQLPAGFSRLYYIQGGEAYYTDAENSFRFEHGHLYLLPTGRKYWMRHNPNDRIDHIYCHITTNPKITSIIDINVDENSLLMDTIKLLRKNIRNPDFSIVLKIVDLLVSSIDSSKFISEYSTDIAFIIKTYIDNNIENEISLDVISKSFHFSKPYIIRFFKKIYHVSPMQYTIQKRLEASINCLKSGMSITQISKKYHYSSPANFSLFFKKRFGVSPKGYLKTLEQDKTNAAKFLI